MKSPKREFARYLRHHATPEERRLWTLLRKQALGFRFCRSALVLDAYIADFLCPHLMLDLELDGPAHASPKPPSRRRG